MIKLLRDLFVLNTGLNFRLFVCIYVGYDNYDANKTILIYNDNVNCDAYKVIIIMMNVNESDPRSNMHYGGTRE